MQLTKARESGPEISDGQARVFCVVRQKGRTDGRVKRNGEEPVWISAEHQRNKSIVCRACFGRSRGKQLSGEEVEQQKHGSSLVSQILINRCCYKSRTLTVTGAKSCKRKNPLGNRLYIYSISSVYVRKPHYSISRLR